MRSRIRAATAALDCSGTSSAPDAVTSVTALVSTSNPASARDTSLATIRSAAFSLSFALRIGDDVVGLGGEADEHRQALLARRQLAELAEDVLRAIQRDRHGPVALLHLFLRRLRRRVVGDGRRHDDRVLAVAALHHGRVHLRGAAHLHHGGAVGSGQVGRSGHQRHRGAAAQRFGGDRVSHASARAVADKTNRIDVFERRARGDQDAASGKRRRRPST